MSVRCPEGHLSESPDYCDTCGSPIGAPSVPSAELLGADGSPAPAPGAEPLTCPHCGAPNVADALFCEACGYDFTTGTPPMGSAPATDEEYADAPDPGAAAPVERVEVEEPEVEEPETEDEPAEEPAAEDEPAEEPAEDEPEPVDEPAAPDPVDEPAAPAPVDEPAAPDPVDEPAARDEDAPEEDAPEDPDAGPEPRPQRRARHTPPSRALAEAWVVELWIDPDWYAVQQTTEAIPSPGVPDIVLLTRSSALIGRPSSLGARPEVDAGADSAVSRRHAQLTSDGQRWWIEDLDSSNGTFVGTVGEPLPSTPLTPGQRVEIDRDDRVYLGAWTRLVLRQATASEQHGTG